MKHSLVPRSSKGRSKMERYEVTVILKSGRETVREIEAYSSYNARDLAAARVDVARVVHVQEAVKS